jgi:hypothetical protein
MSSLFFRILQHLLPRGAAFGRARAAASSWTVGDGSTVGSSLYVGGLTNKGPTLWRFLQGIANGGLDDVRAFLDLVLLDVFPDTTRQLAEWEAQYGLEPAADDATRRLNLAAEWAATGGQSPGYIQGVLQAAGFNVYVYDWFASGPPYSARNPFNYTTQPLIGGVQCIIESSSSVFECEGFASDGSPLADQAQCDAFLANDPHYLVNVDLTLRPPPMIPDSATPDGPAWRRFMYVGGPTFPAAPLPANGDWATVPLSRRDEFQRLLMKLRPTHLWVCTLVNYV